MPDSWRLALGTLTAFPVPPPRVVDQRTARGAMLLAPVVGLLLAVVAAAVLVLVEVLAPGDRARVGVDLLASALAVGTLALTTRGLHLDGLADTADGLGVKGDDDAVARRLAVMRAPDVGAFGVVAVVLVVLVQVTALAVCADAGSGTVALVTAVVTGRLAATWCASTLVGPARDDGLGAAVAGSVPAPAAVLVTLVVLAGATWIGLGDDGGLREAFGLLVAVLAGLAAGTLLLGRCTSRFGGVTGDVIGAVVEVGTAAALVAAALAL